MSEATPRLTPHSDRPNIAGYIDATDADGMLPWSWAEERLTVTQNYFLSTVRPDGSPHTMPIWGVWLDGRYWFSTGSRSRKGRNLAANPRCTVTTEDAANAVIVEGVAEVVDDHDALARFAAAYKAKYDWNIEELAGSPTYAVRPLVAFGMRESDFSSSATRWRFGVRE